MVQIGRDFNQPGAVGTRGSVEIPDSYFSGIVEDIIINEQNGTVLAYKPDGSNIGEAKVRLVPDDWGVSVENLNSAYPMEMNIQDFPLVGEQVIVFKAFNTLFYTRKLSAKRKLTENTTPEIRRIFQQNRTLNPESRDSRELSILGVEENYTTGETNTVQTFSVNPDVRPVRSNLGDIIFQGRYGSAVRMGSSLFKNPKEPVPKANILITAGFWKTPQQLSTGDKITPYSLAYENINKDKSSIWLVEDQQVPFEGATAVIDSPAHLFSSPDKTIKYTGAQIFINSDRIILNSKQNEISLFSRKEINLTSIKAITLDTENDIFVNSLSNVNITAKKSVYIQGDEIAIVSTKNLTYRTSGDYGISGGRIFIGKYGDVTQPMVLGTNLANWLDALMTQLLTPGAFLSATGPVTVNPVIKILLNQLKSQLGTSVSRQSAYFNSKNNFISETNS